MTAEASAILALLLTPGIGYVTVHRLLAASQHSGVTLSQLLHAPPTAQAKFLETSGSNVLRALAKCQPHHWKTAEHLLKQARQRGATITAATDAAYPSALAEYLGNSAPPLLFTLGRECRRRTPGLGIVGTRRPTADGRGTAARYARLAAGRGIPVVSGGAEGIDTEAHRASLEDGGSTLVILPQGLLTYAPPPFIAKALEDGRAWLISEFPPNAPWQTHAAITRNATISALSRMVCVIEPKKPGGSMRTAHCALEQGKTVVVYCTHATDPSAQMLVQAGALRLDDDRDRLNEKRFLELWNQPLATRPQQADMYEA